MSSFFLRGQGQLGNTRGRLLSRHVLSTRRFYCSAVSCGGSGGVMRGGGGTHSLLPFRLSPIMMKATINSRSFSTAVQGGRVVPLSRFLPTSATTSCIRPATTSPLPFGILCQTPRRFYTDKILIGASAASLTCGSTLAIFHLLVTPLSASLAVTTLVVAAITGSMSFLEGEGGRDTQIGAVLGFFVGIFGGYYGKSQHEPWRK